MRLVLLVLLAVSAPLAAQTPRADSLLAVPPTAKYGLVWGDPPAAVVARMGRPPDADVPEGSLTYQSRSGAGQDIFLFTDGGLSSIVQATGAITDLDAALAEYDRYKEAFVNAYGAPALEDDRRPGTDPPVTDNVWAPGTPAAVVELTFDYVVDERGERTPFFYVRTVGRLPTP